MKRSSQVKAFTSNKQKYLYVYYKLGNNIIRIPTGFKYIEGKMTKQNLFSSKVEGYEEKNRQVQVLLRQVDNYISYEFTSFYPEVSQKKCKTYLKEKYNQGSIYPKVKDVQLPISGNSQEIKSLVEYIEEYIAYRKARDTPRNTLKEFVTVKNRIKSFETASNKHTSLADINITWSDHFESYLIKRKYKTGTIGKTYTILITVLYHYYRRREEMGIELTDRFTYPEFKRGGKSKNLANPLTLEQLDVLFNYRFSEKKLENTRIRFCLQCSTGLRYSDIHRITPESIDNHRIVITPKKTRHQKPKPIYIDLNKYSESLLEGLGYDTTSLKIENAPYNRNLKQMFKVLIDKYPDSGFKSNYTSHCGRDTFISVCVQKGVDFKTILQWTGQSSYSIMDRYIFTTDEYKASQMQKVFG